MVVFISLPFRSPVITSKQRAYRGLSIPGMLRVSFVPITRTASSSTATTIEHSRYASELGVSLFQPVNLTVTRGIVVVLPGAVVVVLPGAVVVVLPGAVVVVLPGVVVVVVVVDVVGGGVSTLHVEALMMSLPSSVTAPVCAKARPFKVTLVPKPMDAYARTLPVNEEPRSVAELATFHHTLHALPPTTLEVSPVTRVPLDDVTKIHGPDPVRVSVPSNEKLCEQ